MRTPSAPPLTLVPTLALTLVPTLALVLASCSSPNRPGPHPDERDPKLAPLAPPASGTESAGSGSPPTGTTAPTSKPTSPSPSPPTAAGPAACGVVMCAANQTCCQEGAHQVCLPGTGDETRRACDDQRAAASFEGWPECDESGDCAGGALCCEQTVVSGTTTELCASIEKGRTPCEYREVCREGGACRMPGTVCVDGACVKPLAAGIPCGTETCGASKPICCGEPKACVATRGECAASSEVKCTSDRDCVAGHRCLVDGGTAYCAGVIGPPEHLPYACTSAAQCAPCTTVPKARPKCEPSLVPPLRACSCPYE